MANFKILILITLEQALILRGSSDFETRQDYEAFIAHLMQQRNRRKQERFLLEQRQLQTLPLHPSVNYDELYVTVKRTRSYHCYISIYFAKCYRSKAKGALRWFKSSQGPAH